MTARSALAHKVKSVEGIYLRASMIGRRRPVMQAWADYCEGKSAKAKVARIAERR